MSGSLPEWARQQKAVREAERAARRKAYDDWAWQYAGTGAVFSTPGEPGRCTANRRDGWPTFRCVLGPHDGLHLDEHGNEWDESAKAVA